MVVKKEIKFKNLADFKGDENEKAIVDTLIFALKITFNKDYKYAKTLVLKLENEEELNTIDVAYIINRCVDAGIRSDMMWEISDLLKVTV